MHSKEMLTPNVCKLRLETTSTLVYRPGQFINIRRADGLIRSYSLASLPEEDYYLEIHVQRKVGGIMSNWILDELTEGAELEIQGASGECYYKEDAHEHPLLLIASGTGLSPLIGIVREALQKQHREEIHLYHGASDKEQFYLRATLFEMQRQHANFHYHECVSDSPALEYTARVDEVALALHPDLANWHIYLAGQLEMVERGEKLAAARGASPERIHADAFALRDLRSEKREPDRAISTEGNEAAAKYPPADPELWAALRNGELLMEVLQEFYGRVFQDERLASFFHGVTKQRSIEKQYLFTRQILTGDKVYFGDRPRNSHHWMVISDELFDYRSGIMSSCLRKFGLTEAMIDRFREMEEFYRKDIVKSAPFARMSGNVEIPFEGFGEVVLDVGSLCDTCGREVAAGEKVMYHVRLGNIYCSDCSSR